jgi:hypothetical protein
MRGRKPKKITWVENWEPAKIAGLSTPCWECTSHTANTVGYSILRFQGRETTMHRALYQQKYGVLPKEVLLRHQCDNRKCINLSHLIEGSSFDNRMDCVSRGRHNSLSGEDHPFAKLNWEKVAEIRSLSDLTLNKLSSIYGVNRAQIRKIRANESWIIK